MARVIIIDLEAEKRCLSLFKHLVAKQNEVRFYSDLETFFSSGFFEEIKDFDLVALYFKQIYSLREVNLYNFKREVASILMLITDSKSRLAVKDKTTVVFPYNTPDASIIYSVDKMLT